jgi:GH15 family glucan-1,4-alpha-glucosidase
MTGSQSLSFGKKSFILLGMYPYGLIGNCQISALVHQSGSIDWLCLPRPDSEPVFGKILDREGGCFSIFPSNESDLVHTKQEYLTNTNVLVTEVSLKDGSRYRITDFCPRFEQYGRMYRPAALFRILEPIEGVPLVTVRCNPVKGWSKEPAGVTRGNSHLRYDAHQNHPDELRLITSMPLTYLEDQQGFSLKEKTYFALTSGVGIEDDLVQVSEQFLSKTVAYWRKWVRHCSVPYLYQKETIRSALTLKLHVYEDTGAILAALTTSLPESQDSGRNWDYRYCWIRDAYYVLTAFHNLGHFEEMEGFLKFVLNLVHRSRDEDGFVRPVYNLSEGVPLPEEIHANWEGYGEAKPVRSKNQAAEHVQNDAYGEMVLTLAPIFFDERFLDLRTKDHESLLEHLAEKCAKTISLPDAGLWEIRDGWQEHSFTNLMCWAGLDRVHRIHQMGYLKGLTIDVAKERDRAYLAVKKALVGNVVQNSPGDHTLDASLSQLGILGFPDGEITEATVDAILQGLSLSAEDSAFFFRYKRQDDFGKPESAFVICSFWVIQAMAKIGRKDEARALMDQALQASNSLGLVSEHFLPKSKLQLGNFPQAYSHVGLINAAFALSPNWTDVL